MTCNSVWEEVYRTRPWGQYPGEDVIRFIAGHFYRVPDRSTVRLLEVGSGAGANLWFMAREGFSVYGVEGSETAVRLSTERLDRECPGWREAGGRVDQANLYPLAYPDSYFNAVLDVVAVCYSSFEQAQAIYAELARVTKPGGHLFVRTFAAGCWGDETGTRVEDHMWLCAEGPLKDLGATRFTLGDDVGALLQGWSVDRIEHASTTENSGQHQIRHLQIRATRIP
jgi:SAM-dependent methyltransferase